MVDPIQTWGHLHCLYSLFYFFVSCILYLTKEKPGISCLIPSKFLGILYFNNRSNAGGRHVALLNICLDELVCALGWVGVCVWVSFFPPSKLWLPFNIYSIGLSPLVVFMHQSRVIPQIIRFAAFKVTFATIERKPIGCF